MLSRGNLYTKYKSYSKSIKFIKDNYSLFNKRTLLNVKNNVQDLKNDIFVSLNIRNSTTNNAKIGSSSFNENRIFISKEQQLPITTTHKLLDQCIVNKSWIKKLQSKPLFGAVAISTITAQASNGSSESVLNAVSAESTVAATQVLQSSASVVEAIPEPPPIPAESIPEVIETLNALGEQTLQSLGIAGWSPVGIVQQCLEFLHVSCDLPWWGAIAVGTVIVRILMFPLVIAAQKNGAKMNNYLPQLQMLQLKMTEARQSGNQLEAARYSQEMMIFMREKNLNPLKNMIVPLAQMPVFLSFFMGLRGMCNVPVQSFATGGLLWFTDLTLPDQYFALPIITSLTLWLTIEIGTDSAKLSAQNMQIMKYVLRAMPVLILPFTVNFPGAILCYWVASNFISLGQVGFLKIPSVRKYFNIEQLVSHQPDKLPIKNKGFVAGVKDSWTNMKISRDLDERRRLDEMQFQRAGKGPVAKTYKYDPTKQATGPKVIRAKER